MCSLRQVVVLWVFCVRVSTDYPLRAWCNFLRYVHLVFFERWVSKFDWGSPKTQIQYCVLRDIFLLWVTDTHTHTHTYIHTKKSTIFIGKFWNTSGWNAIWIRDSKCEDCQTSRGRVFHWMCIHHTNVIFAMTQQLVYDPNDSSVTEMVMWYLPSLTLWLCFSLWWLPNIPYEFHLQFWSHLPDLLTIIFFMNEKKLVITVDETISHSICKLAVNYYPILLLQHSDNLQTSNMHFYWGMYNTYTLVETSMRCFAIIILWEWVSHCDDC